MNKVIFYMATKCRTFASGGFDVPMSECACCLVSINTLRVSRGTFRTRGCFV